MTKTLAVTLSLLLLMLSSLAFAQGGGLRAGCAADFQKYCAGMGPGSVRRQCLMDNQDKLSDGCKSAIAEARTKIAGAREACAADAQKYCADAEPGQGRMKCMKESEDKLSDGCRSAIAAMGR